MFGAVKREKSSSFEVPGSLVLAVVGLVVVIIAATILVAIKIA